MRTIKTQIAIALILNLGASANSAASTVLMYVSSQEVVLAADSLSNHIEGGHGLVCKVAQVSDHELFAATGTGRMRMPSFDPYDVAR